MGRLLSIFIMLCFVPAFPGFSQTIKEQPFRPYYAETSAQGDSGVAVAEGYNALFTNPAGFANGKSEMTIASFSLWTLARPDRAPALLDLLRTRDGSGPDSTDLLATQFTSDGFGIGTALGIGYVGGGFGIGFQAGFDSFFQGSSFPDNLQGLMTAEFSLVVGYAFTFQLPGIKLLLGADVRPLVRIHSLFDSAATAGLVHKYFGAETMSDDVDPFEATGALNGSGIALDGGLIALAGPFSFGLSARDIFDTELRYSWNSLASVKSSIFEGSLPPAGPVPGGADYIVPMSVSAGAAFHPDLGNLTRIFDPEIHCELYDPFGALDPSGTNPSFMDRLRVGAEVTLLSRISLRGGMRGGLPSAGAGLRLYFLDVNFAVFGTRIGSDSRGVPGASMEIAFRW